MVKPQAKPAPRKQSKAKPNKSAPTPGVQKLVPPPKPKPTTSIGGAEKRKEKPSRQYVAAEAETTG